MNYKLMVGRTFTFLENKLRKSNLAVVNKIYPWGRQFVFDLKRLFPNDIDVIFDVGANVGSVSKEFHSYFPQASIIAFEPISSTYQKLQEQLRNNKQILPVNLALGNEINQLEIPLSKEHTINSISSFPSEDDIIGYEIINIDTIENYAKQNSISKIDILKIDVEGFEFEVLRGAKSFLLNSIKAIILEVGYVRGKDKVHFSDVESFMEENDFQCVGIYDQSRSSNKKILYYSNNLYVKKTLI